MPRLAPVTRATAPSILRAFVASSFLVFGRSQPLRRTRNKARRSGAGVTTATGLRSDDGFLDHGGRARAARGGSARRAQARRPAGRPGGPRSARDRDGPARGPGASAGPAATGGAGLRAAGDGGAGALPDGRGGGGAGGARHRLATAGADRSPTRVCRSRRSGERGPRPTAATPTPLAARPGRRGGQRVRCTRPRR